MDPLTMTINDAQKAVGLGRTTIYSLIAGGQIETVKIGRRRLVKAASLRKLVEAA